MKKIDYNGLLLASLQAKIFEESLLKVKTSSEIFIRIENPNYKVDNLLKLTSQNINQSNNIFTVPYYLSFYILNK